MSTIDSLTPAAAEAVPSKLLDLPPVLLHEVASWSPDGATASALLKTCTDLNRMGHDPAAAALLLVRCPSCTDHTKALAASSRACGGGTAVVHQVLRLLCPSLSLGAPHLATLAPLLQAMLALSAECGDARAVHAILALPQPPDVDAHGGHALHLAVVGPKGPHLPVMRALLERGADPCAGAMRAVIAAASQPSHLPALQLLLLQHCPAADQPRAAAIVLNALTRHDNAAAVALLLPLLGAADADSWLNRMLALVAGDGHAATLQVLMARPLLPVTTLGRALRSAAHNGHAACVELLLARGAHKYDHKSVDVALLRSVEGEDWQGERVPEESQREVVRLLLEHGAAVTAAVCATAAEAVSAHVMCMLWQARAAASGV